MVLGPKLPDLLDQLFLRVLDVNLVDALRVLDSCRTPLARLVAITLHPSAWVSEARRQLFDAAAFGVRIEERRNSKSTDLGPCLFTVEAGIARNGSGDSSMFG